MIYQKTDTLLKIDNVSLKFGDNLVLRDINLEVKDIVTTDQITGQIITLLGKSGAGKTQLLKMIAGLVTPTDGIIKIGIDQKDVTPGSVGMVLQTYPLFVHRTLLSNLQLVSKDKERIDFFLNEFDMLDHKDKYPSQLSGGQRQRGAIIQQLLCSDNFILFDEPLSGLDPVATDKLCSNIRKIVNLDEHNTVIISSHILEPALAISDSVLMLGHHTTTDLPSDGILALTPEKLPGATIKHSFDLAADGLAWNPDIRKDSRFIAMVEEIRELFKTL